MPFNESTLASIVLTHLPAAWRAQYALTHKLVPESPRAILNDLENIEKLFAEKVNEAARANKAKVAAASKAVEAEVADANEADDADLVDEADNANEAIDAEEAEADKADTVEAEASVTR